MNILVTGGAGNIGGSLVRKLVENNKHYVVIADNLSTGFKEKLPSKNFKNWKFCHIDVNNYQQIKAIFQNTDFDYVFHYAAVVGVERTLAQPLKVLEDIEGIKNILNLCKDYHIKRVFFSSSSEVYGEPVEIPQIEDTTPLNSRLPYAIVKNVSEAFCRVYKQQYDLDFSIFRFFNTYGALQTNDFVITKFIEQALTNQDITIYGNGKQTRTFCYIDDNIETTIKVMESNFCINDVMNIGSNFEISIINLAQLIIKLTQSKSNIIHLPALKEGDMSRRKPDISKMQQILKRELTPLKLGIQLIIKQQKTLALT